MKYATFNDIGYALGVIAKNTALIKKKEAVLNDRIAKLKADFESDVRSAVEENGMLTGEISSYCLVNKSQFEAQRTMTFASGEIGFRNNPPKVMQLNRKYTVATSVELIKKIFKGGYLRVKEEIDKETLLADYSNKELTDQKLASVGLKIDQGETFFVKPNWEVLVDKDTRVKIEAMSK